MIADITGDGPIQIAIQRAFDVLGCEDAIGVVGYLELHPDDAISVLIALDHRDAPKRSSPPASGPAILPFRQIASQTATMAKARMAQSPGRVAKRQNPSEVTCDGSQRLAPQGPSF